MRYKLQPEEEATVRSTLPPQKEQKEQDQPKRQEHQEQPAITLPQAHSPRRSKKAKPDRSRALRLGILLFGTLGIFGGVVPAVTGVPLQEWLGGANLKKAYSGPNFTYIGGSAALKVGNLSAATSALQKIDFHTSEAQDLAAALFPRLLEAEEYKGAVQVIRHMTQNSSPPQVAVSSTELARHLLERHGLEKAVSIVKQDPDLATLQAEILTQMFTTAANKSLPSVKQAATSMTGIELAYALDSMYTWIKTAQEADEIWGRSKEVPLTAQVKIRQKAISKLSQDPRLAFQRLKELDSSVESDSIRVYAVYGIAANAPELLPDLLASIKNTEQRDLALKGLANSKGIAETLALVQQQVTPEVKLETLSMLAMRQHTAKDMAQVLPHLAAVARQSPALIEKHDKTLEAIVQARARTDGAIQELCLNAVLNPATKAELLQLWKTGKLGFVNGVPMDSPQPLR